MIQDSVFNFAEYKMGIDKMARYFFFLEQTVVQNSLNLFSKSKIVIAMTEKKLLVHFYFHSFHFRYALQLNFLKCISLNWRVLVGLLRWHCIQYNMHHLKCQSNSPLKIVATASNTHTHTKPTWRLNRNGGSTQRLILFLVRFAVLQWWWMVATRYNRH